jgi:hypothetical protein
MLLVLPSLSLSSLQGHMQYQVGFRSPEIHAHDSQQRKRRNLDVRGACRGCGPPNGDLERLLLRPQGGLHVSQRRGYLEKGCIVQANTGWMEFRGEFQESTSAISVA